MSKHDAQGQHFTSERNPNTKISCITITVSCIISFHGVHHSVKIPHIFVNRVPKNPIVVKDFVLIFIRVIHLSFLSTDLCFVFP